ncbi:MAG: AsmA family protein, partial [Wenzhouxiangella sp.]|nr:AsmA family protein [Wenzhouxiangella sp.]
MRRLSVLLVGVLIMSVGFIASLMMLGDEERLKRLLAAHVQNQLGRELHIEGSVSLSLFPRLEIRASDVRLSGADAFNEIDLLTSDQLSASIKLTPLLRGRVEAENLAVEGANLNLLFDESGQHSLAGIVHYGDREMAPGILVNGPLRLENLSLQIGRLGADSLQRISVDRVELDGLAFDRALHLVFEGAIGMPAVIEDVSVSGVLFVPAGTGIFRLSEMRMTGKARGAPNDFQLSGSLDVSAQPPLGVTLHGGLLEVDGHQAVIEGNYQAGQRPFFEVSLSGDTLDPVHLSRGLATGDAIDALALIAGWTALHDYDLALQSDQLVLGRWPLSNAVFKISAEGGMAEIQDARAGIPGGTLEIVGDLAVEEE